MSDILRRHADMYPEMLPCDAVKLLNQSEFGGGHLTTDYSTCLDGLIREWTHNLTPAPTSPLSEDIGGGLARIQLNSVTKDELPLIARMFISSASLKGTYSGMTEKLKLLRELTGEGVFSFSLDELDKFLQTYELDGRPLLSHSDLYREKYRPAYRVVDARYISLFPLIRKIHRLTRDLNHVIVAIDGPCAAGKTTAAGLLHSIFDCPVIHMDHFFLPQSLRTPQRYAQAGGNIHYERFENEVIRPLLANRRIEYGAYDCSAGKITHNYQFDPSNLIVIEGAYSLHPYFKNYFNISVYMDVTPNIQKDRLLARNGEDGWIRFQDVWIPLEQNYFKTYNIKEKADIVISV